MCRTSSRRPVFVSCLLVALVCGGLVTKGTAAEQEAKSPRRKPAAAPPARTEETKPAASAEDNVIKVYFLKYISGDIVPGAIQLSAPEAQATFDERTNSVILIAPPATHLRVEKLIETLDVPPFRNNGQRPELHLYQLQHVDADYAAATVEFLLSPGESLGAGDRVRVEADPKNNRLLLYAPSHVQEEVKALLEKIDAPPEADAGLQIKLFSLVYAEATTAAETLSGLFTADDVQISVDPRTNSIVAKGSPSSLQVMENLLLRLDEAQSHATAGDPSTTLQVRVVWLASGLDGLPSAGHEEAPPNGRLAEPADDLKGVLGELSKIGIKGVRQVGQTVVNTTGGGMFEISCVPMLAQAPATMKIRGTLQEEQGVPQLGMHISGHQVVYLQRPDNGQIEHSELVSLETEIAAPYGQYVVLGVIPAGKMTSVFVVRVTANEP